MTETKTHYLGVIAIISHSREFMPELGFYIQHFINEGNKFFVRLSNGEINIPVELAKEYEIQASKITEEKIKQVAESFIKHIKNK